jgi:hypothetical protein
MDSKQKNTMSNCTTKLNDWIQTPQTKYISIEVCKIFTGLLFLLSFFLPTNSILFTLVISTAIGSSYYLLCETQPQFMMIMSILVKYKINKLKHFIPLSLIGGRKLKDSTIRLQKDDNFIFLEYYDNDENNHKKYIYLFDQKLRSNDVIIFKDELDNDITASIEPYLGPMQNFHGVPLTPNDFNHKKIKIFRDGDICMSKTFEENQPLIMK